MQVKKFEIIDNSGPNNLRDNLKAMLAKASQADIASAFITDAGLTPILQALRQVATRGKVRILTGLYQSVTEPKALRTLLRAQNETHGRLSARLSTEPEFHRKIYLLRDESKVTAIIGSSNLTKEGLTSGGELDILFSLPARSSSFLFQTFGDDWENRAVSLNDERIRLYEHYRRTLSMKTTRARTQLQKILGKRPTHRHAPLVHDETITFWRDYVTDLIRKRTEQIVKETTNWDEKRYGYFAAGAHQYKIGDRLLLLDFTENNATIVEVKDITCTAVPTPDGRNFVAHNPVQRFSKKRLTKNLFNRLKSIGLLRNRKDAKIRRKISPSKWNELLNVLRKR